MHCNSAPDQCQDCPARLVCRCLRVTEEVLLNAVTTFEIKTVKELRRHTGAGDGCTACHAQLRQFLEAHSDRESETVAGSLAYEGA